VKKWKTLSNGRPFLLKGIQHPDDARKAMEAGCDGVVCSNHAGRQVDGAVGSLDMLPEVCDSVLSWSTVIANGNRLSKASGFGHEGIDMLMSLQRSAIRGQCSLTLVSGRRRTFSRFVQRLCCRPIRGSWLIWSRRWRWERKRFW